MRAVHLYQSNLTHESRILRVVRSLVAGKAISECDVLGVWEPGLPKTESVGPGVRFIRLPTAASRLSRRRWLRPLLLAEWSARALVRLLSGRVSVIHCHSLVTLPLCAGAKLVRGVPLVYEPHELETERNGLSGIRKRLNQWMERLLIPLVDSCIVVSPEIEQWYRTRYPALADRITTLHNYPSPKGERTERADSPLRPSLGIPEEALVFLYQGVLTRGRGVEVLLEAFEKAGMAGGERHLVFLGGGNLEGLVHAAASRHPNIHYHPMVPPDQTLRYTAGADVGISLIEDICLSYRYCSPNKLFEYLWVGIPVLASNLPTMARVVESHECGWVVEPSADSLRNWFQTVTRDSIGRKSMNSRQCRGLFHWEHEAPKLVALYEKALRTHGKCSNVLSTSP